MSATIDQIDAALFAQLSTLSSVPPTPSTPFNTVRRWWGRFPTPNDLRSGQFGQTPAILLAMEGEQGASEGRTLQGASQNTGLSTWVAIVITEDNGSADAIAKGDVALVGAYALHDMIVGALNGLVIQAPAATLRFTITGDPNVTYPIDPAQMIAVGSFLFKPTTASFATGSNGLGTIDAVCVTIGELGNLLGVQYAAWSPARVDLPSAFQVTSTTTPGADGLLRNTRVDFSASQVFPVASGRMAVAVIRFTAKRALPAWNPPDDTAAYAGTTGNEHLLDQLSTGYPDPFDVFKDR